MYIDIESLRKDLIDYYGAAWQAGMPAAIVDMGNVKAADDEEVVEIALKNRFDLKKYEIR